ncbi:hypothetical protein Tco_0412941 [Tanacetum coccineum]
MSRTNSQDEIVSEEQLVPRANRLVIKKNNQRVASDSHITDTMLRFVVEILRQHKLYKPVSLTATVPIIYLHQSQNKDDCRFKNGRYKTSSTIESYSECSYQSLLGKGIKAGTTVRLPIIQILWGDYRFGMEIPDTMISDAIKKLAGYKFYMAKKVKSENAKTVDEPEEQHVSPVKSRRGKGFMCYGNQVANVPTSLKKDVVPRKTRSQTIVEEIVIGELADSISIQELRTQQRLSVEDPAVQSLLDLRKGLKASRLESLRQKKQAVAGEGSSAAHNKYYDSSDNDSEAILYSSNDDATRYGVLMHNKSTATSNSTYLSLKIKLLHRIQESKSNMTHPTYQKLYDTLYESVCLDHDTLNDPDAEPSFHKRVHDNQDPPNNREREKRKKHRKDVGKTSSKSSRRNKSPLVHAQDDTPDIQLVDQEDEYIRTRLNLK